MQQCEDNNIEKSENLKRMFVELVLQTRKIYLEHHEKNPGFFSLVVIYIYIHPIQYVPVLKYLISSNILQRTLILLY